MKLSLERPLENLLLKVFSYIIAYSEIIMKNSIHYLLQVCECVG